LSYIEILKIRRKKINPSEIFVIGSIILLILFIAFGVTIVEFIKMDKDPENYKNPRYKDK
tara:strand:- start:908 stop:1087 length:180 start_codon:yes stop_codon:yes gene_type:complete